MAILRGQPGYGTARPQPRGVACEERDRPGRQQSGTGPLGVTGWLRALQEAGYPARMGLDQEPLGLIERRSPGCYRLGENRDGGVGPSLVEAWCPDRSGVLSPARTSSQAASGGSI